MYLILNLTIDSVANIQKNIENITTNLPKNVKLIAVTKLHEVDEIIQIYEAGVKTYGENRPQELVRKRELLPEDVSWHLIGSLQTNKVKYIAPFVSLIHSIDSAKLLEVVNKEAVKCSRVIDVLMEVFVAEEETKHGWDKDELIAYMESDCIKSLTNIRVRGIMGMASFTSDSEQVRGEFKELKKIFDTLSVGREHFDTLSMGMSGDYKLAIEEGSTMVRVGSAIFQ